MSKAKVVETVERDGRTIDIYDNGMERDVERGRLVRGPANTLITAENATVFYRQRLEKKRQRARDGANAVLRRIKDKKTGEPLWENPQGMDFIEALTEAQMEEAMMGGAYATRAAEFVVNTTGYNERTLEAEAPPASAEAERINAYANLLRAMTEAGIGAPPQPDAADGELLDAEPTLTSVASDNE